MGPLGFALGLEVALEQARQAAAVANEAEGWEIWYLDDGLVVGNPERVAAFLGALYLALPQVGL